MKQEINIFDYAKEIMSVLPKGVLLTTKFGKKVNTMTIGWGALGFEWSKPIFVAYVRESRFTFEQLEKSSEFTVNIPLDHVNLDIIKYCGSESGRICDKIKEHHLTLEEPIEISTPGIKEFPLTLECKVIYKSKQDVNDMRTEGQIHYYPVDENNHLKRDLHYVFYGEIVKAYVIK